MSAEFGEQEIVTPPTPQLYFNEQSKVKTSRDFYDDFNDKQKMQVVVKTKHIIAQDAVRHNIINEPKLFSIDEAHYKT